jgi:nicotinate-nucleotide adenylyltransferase
MSQLERIALLGGSFNPPHLGHLFLADQVIHELHYDRVIFVPARVRPLKEMASGAGDADRLEMLRLACRRNPRFEVDDCELSRNGPSFTFDTIQYIEGKYSGSNRGGSNVGESTIGKIGLIIGDDLIPDFESWYRYRDLVEKCDIILARRLRGEGEIPFPYPHLALDNALLTVSSTDIRGRIAEGRSFRYLMPPKVYNYIIEKGLYQDPRLVRLQEQAERILSTKRFNHTVRVAETARSLCKKYGLDEHLGYFAGMGHDLCKEMTNEAILAMVTEAGRPLSPIEQDKPGLLHGWAASRVLERDFGVQDETVLEATEHHTFGKTGMGPLAKVIFVADKIEPGRAYVNREYLKNLRDLTLDELTLSVLEDNIEHLIHKGKRVAGESFELLEELNGAVAK